LQEPRVQDWHHAEPRGNRRATAEKLSFKEGEKKTPWGTDGRSRLAEGSGATTAKIKERVRGRNDSNKDLPASAYESQQPRHLKGVAIQERRLACRRGGNRAKDGVGFGNSTNRLSRKKNPLDDKGVQTIRKKRPC